mmetsp:Transcript_9290/g.23284  ORF Transcript_9290/g.23284 Transcript_9290/m.23284 type:complete len:410 (+) Transcript_9290:1570-2799(+)
MAPLLDERVAQSLVFAGKADDVPNDGGHIRVLIRQQDMLRRPVEVLVAHTELQELGVSPAALVQEAVKVREGGNVVLLRLLRGANGHVKVHDGIVELGIAGDETDVVRAVGANFVPECNQFLLVFIHVDVNVFNLQEKIPECIEERSELQSIHAGLNKPSQKFEVWDQAEAPEYGFLRRALILAQVGCHTRVGGMRQVRQQQVVYVLRILQVIGGRHSVRISVDHHLLGIAWQQRLHECKRGFADRVGGTIHQPLQQPSFLGVQHEGSGARIAAHKVGQVGDALQCGHHPLGVGVDFLQEVPQRRVYPRVLERVGYVQDDAQRLEEGAELVVLLRVDHAHDHLQELVGHCHVLVAQVRHNFADGRKIALALQGLGIKLHAEKSLHVLLGHWKKVLPLCVRGQRPRANVA